jgi:hypothetical protein
MNMTRDDIVGLVRDGSKYRRKRAAWDKFWVALLVQLMLAPLAGWWFMLGVGVIHHEWWPAVPTVGYWWSIVIVYLLRASLSTTRTEAKS